MAYFITDTCIGCTVCELKCPVVLHLDVQLHQAVLTELGMARVK